MSDKSQQPSRGLRFVKDDLRLGDPCCPGCKEPILDGTHTEVVLSVDGIEVSWHYECRARRALGSVGHQLGLCVTRDTCWGLQAGEDSVEDPPGLTRRQAAREAVVLARMMASKDLATFHDLERRREIGRTYLTFFKARYSGVEESKKLLEVWATVMEGNGPVQRR